MWGGTGALRRAALGFWLAVALAAPGAAAADEIREAALCDRAIAHGARTVGVPVEVLRAIALTETGRRVAGRFQAWPWAINREGRGYWFGSREEALAFARTSVAEKRPSFDMSCFQINYHWHGHNFPSLEAMIDPDAAAVYAASFLRDLHRELGTWPAAAGAYHSRTPEYASRYRLRFERILAGLAPGGVADGFVAAAAPSEPPAPPRVVPVRQLDGPKIITLGGRGAAPRAAGARVLVVELDAAVAPLVGGGRL